MSEDSVRRVRDLFVRAAEEYYSLKSGHAQYLLEKLVEIGETDSDVTGLAIFPIAHYQLGVIHTDHSPDQAIECFERALSLGLEKNADLCRQLGCAYQVVGRYKEAIQVLLESALAKALDLIAKSDIHGWFKHCGYLVASD